MHNVVHFHMGHDGISHCAFGRFSNASCRRVDSGGNPIMARKKKSKKVTLAAVRNYSPGGESVTTFVADHTVAYEDMPFRGEVMTMEFEDPWADKTTDGKVERALNTVTTRDDFLAHSYARKTITARQFAAGRKWEHLYETVEGQGRCLILRMAIDQDPTVEHQTAIVQAANDLQDTKAVLGYNYKFFALVLCTGISLQEAAAEMGWNPHKGSDDMRGLRFTFRACLEALADHWGLA